VEFMKTSLGIIQEPSVSYSPILFGASAGFGGGPQGLPHHPEDEQNGAGVEL
jgi:hypothetical protein